MSNSDSLGGTANVFGLITFYSFISVVIFFVSMLFLAGINNYGLQSLEAIASSFDSAGIISTNISTHILSQEGLSNFLPYLDNLWLISFIALVVGSIGFSYYTKRQDLFGLFNFIVLGIIILTYFGSIVIQMTTWFKDEVLYSVFPSLVEVTPKFAWYLDNLAIINLILVSVCILANFVELNLVKFKMKKGGDMIEEI